MITEVDNNLGEFEEYVDVRTGHQFRAAEIQSELLMPERRGVGHPGQYLVENHVTGERNIVDEPSEAGLTPVGSLLTRVVRLMTETPVRIMVVSDSEPTLEEFRGKLKELLEGTSIGDSENLLVFRMIGYGGIEIIEDQDGTFDLVLLDKDTDLEAGQFDAIHEAAEKSMSGEGYDEDLPALEQFSIRDI